MKKKTFSHDLTLSKNVTGDMEKKNDSANVSDGDSN